MPPIPAVPDDVCHEAHHLALEVEQGASRVPHGEGGVGEEVLPHFGSHARVRQGNLQGAHPREDAEGGQGPLAVGEAHQDHPHPQGEAPRLHLGEGQHPGGPRPPDGEEGEVNPGVHGVALREKRPSVGEPDGEVLEVPDHVVVGDHPARPHEEARAHHVLPSGGEGASLDAHHRGEGLLDHLGPGHLLGGDQALPQDQGQEEG